MYSPERLEKGIAEFNDGRYVESHDAWEEEWREEEGERRRFMQALLQLAAGAQHAARGNRRGAQVQLGRALAKLTAYPSRYIGLDVQALCSDVETLRASIDAGGDASAPMPPAVLTIQYMRELQSRLGRFREPGE